MLTVPEMPVIHVRPRHGGALCFRKVCLGPRAPQASWQSQHSASIAIAAGAMRLLPTCSWPPTFFAAFNAILAGLPVSAACIRSGFSPMRQRCKVIKVEGHWLKLVCFWILLPDRILKRSCATPIGTSSARQACLKESTRPRQPSQ